MLSSLNWTALLFVAAVPPATAAGLEWETTRIERSATAGDRDVTVEFPFKNTTNEEISILAVKTSCDCTTATSSKWTIAPGASAVIEAVFTLGKRVGQQEKTIQVTTSAASGDPTTLVLRVDIAEIVAGSPRVLFWKVGEPAREKIMEIVPLGGHPILTVSLPRPVPGFSCHLVSNSAKKHQLKITPLSTTAPANAVIELVAQIEGRPAATFGVYALVK